VRTVVLCPFTADTVLWQKPDGAWTLTAVVRGAFSLVHGREALLADTQEPIGGDRFYDMDPRAALYAPSDLVPYKPRTDIILVGEAYAPLKQPVEALIVRLSIGEIDKQLGVIGDRTWIEGPDGLEPSAPAPFTSMPLRAERAARAPDNPVGFDLTLAPTLGALAMPNLETVDDAPLGGRSVGFGPIAPHASTRRAWLSPEGLSWVEGGCRGRAPQDLDFSFFNAAPRDQQVSLLRQGDRLVLENLHREHPRLETRIPYVKPKVFLTNDALDQGTEIAMRCDTLFIDTARALMVLTWRGLAELGAHAAVNTVVVGAEPKGRELRFSHIQRTLRDNTSVSLDEDSLGDTLPHPIPVSAIRGVPAMIAPAPSALPRPPSAPTIWEEISSSELMEATATDEPTDFDGATTEAPTAPPKGVAASPEFLPDWRVPKT